MMKTSILLKSSAVVVALTLGTSIFAQESIFIDFEGDETTAEQWMPDNAELTASIAIEENAGARSGNKVLKISDYTKSTGHHFYNSDIKLVVPNNKYVHVLYHMGAQSAAGDDVIVKAIGTFWGDMGKPTPGLQEHNLTASITEAVYDGSTRQNTTGDNADVHPCTRFRPMDITDIVYFDDIIMYYDDNEKFDFVSPEPATELIGDGTANISWTTGVDTLSGVVETLIFSTAVETPAELVIQNQSNLKIGDVIGDWKVVEVETADATSYSAVEGEKHAIVMKDLAYNYSTPLVAETQTSINITDVDVKVFPNPCASGIFSIQGAHSWTVFNMLGEKVLSGSGNTIDLSQERGNVYLLKSGQSVRKLIKK